MFARILFELKTVTAGRLKAQGGTAALPAACAFFFSRFCAQATVDHVARIALQMQDSDLYITPPAVRLQIKLSSVISSLFRFFLLALRALFSFSSFSER
jgi:hypothetical protein